jgi:hypothetical protein
MNRVMTAVACLAVLVVVVIGAYLLKRWAFRRDCLPIEGAKSHVGEDVTVCYTVNTAGSNMVETVLNSEVQTLNPATLAVTSGFSTIIPAKVRSGFKGDPTGLFIGRLIKVRGRLESDSVNGDLLHITISQPDQIAAW